MPMTAALATKTRGETLTVGLERANQDQRAAR